MKSPLHLPAGCRFAWASVILFPLSAAWGYRPFVLTDASVADAKKMKVELGYFNLERGKGTNPFIIPNAVLNYGLVENFELIGLRRGISPATADWVVTKGLTFSFSLATISHN